MNYLRIVAQEIRSHVDAEHLPDSRAEALFDLYAVLARSIGTSVTSEHVHDAWVAWMLAQDPTHPALVPYRELDAETAASDHPYVEAIRAVARDLASRSGDGDLS